MTERTFVRGAVVCLLAVLAWIIHRAFTQPSDDMTAFAVTATVLAALAIYTARHHLRGKL